MTGKRCNEFRSLELSVRYISISEVLLPFSFSDEPNEKKFNGNKFKNRNKSQIFIVAT
jgi:hypothetical protein